MLKNKNKTTENFTNLTNGGKLIGTKQRINPPINYIESIGIYLEKASQKAILKKARLYNKVGFVLQNPNMIFESMLSNLKEIDTKKSLELQDLITRKKEGGLHYSIYKTLSNGRANEFNVTLEKISGRFVIPQDLIDELELPQGIFNASEIIWQLLPDGIFFSVKEKYSTSLDIISIYNEII